MHGNGVFSWYEPILQFMGFEISVLCSHIPSYSRFPRTFRKRRAATADLSRLWQDGVIPYQIEANFTGVLLIHTQKICVCIASKQKIKACLSTLSMIFNSLAQYDLYQVPHTCLYMETFFLH